MTIKNLRQFLSENNLDYLLINSTDEFLVEYNELSNNARYFATGFSGSTGDALLSKENLWQFADGRYHEQADQEVSKGVTVVKQKLGESVSDLLSERIKPHSTLGIVTKKVSLNFYKTLKKKLNEKFVKIVDLDSEPVQKLTTSDKGETVQEIDLNISGLSADDKFKKLSKKLRKNHIYLETNLENIAYLSNLREYKTPYSSTFKAKMAVYKNKAVIFTDEKVNITAKNFEIKPLKDFKDFKEEASFNLTKKSLHIFYNPSTINYADYKLIKKFAVPLRKNRISEMKVIKNEAEIAHFKRNFERTDKVVAKIEKMIEENKNQTQTLNEEMLSAEVEKEYLKLGAKQLSFKTILASGPNSSIIHYSQPSKDVLVKDGDFVLLDCGGHFEGGYSTDITRTFCKGEPSALQKRVYTTVLKMFLNAYHYKVNSRTTGCTLDRVARKIAKKSGLIEEGFNFNHGLGHGVGISVHESPPVISCGLSGKRFLKENMVFTIEPGLYCKDFGGVRLENTVYLTKENNISGEFVIQSLSKSKFQEKCIDFQMLNEEEKIWLSQWQGK